MGNLDASPSPLSKLNNSHHICMTLTSNTWKTRIYPCYIHNCSTTTAQMMNIKLKCPYTFRQCASVADSASMFYCHNARLNVNRTMHCHNPTFKSIGMPSQVWTVTYRNLSTINSAQDLQSFSTFGVLALIILYSVADRFSLTTLSTPFLGYFP